MNTIDKELTEQQAHDNFCEYYNWVVAKRYLMTEAEYTQYFNEIMAKTDGSNNHDVRTILGHIHGFIEMANLAPEKVLIYTERILNAKARIYQLIKCL